MESARTNKSQFVKVARPRGKDGEGERWDYEQVCPTLNAFDNGDTRAVVLITKKQNAVGHN